MRARLRTAAGPHSVRRRNTPARRPLHPLLSTSGLLEPTLDSAHTLVVVGASAGGIRALEVLVAGLPVGFPAAVCVVCHTSPHAPGVLDQILRRSGPLPVTYAEDGEPIRAGHIYVAPADRHLVIQDGHLRVTRGPKENRFRPAVDPLFRSAALAYGPHTIGVVLSGMLSDGTAGLWTVKDRGGVAVVQDPAEAAFSAMPRNALEEVRVDACLPVAEIPAALVAFVERSAQTAMSSRTTSPADERDERDRIEVQIAMEDGALEAGVMGLGEPSVFTCPECHGVLLRLKGDGPMRFRCHTGHAYSTEALLDELNESVEATIWSAVRAIEERAMLLGELAEHLRTEGHPEPAARYAGEVEDLRQRLQLVRHAFLDERPADEGGAPGA